MYRSDLKRAEWEDYAVLRREDPYRAKLFRMKMKESSPVSDPFFSYWIMNMKVHYDESPDDAERDADMMLKALSIAKEVSANKTELARGSKARDTFHGTDIAWEYLMPYNEQYNSYDAETQKCVVPWKMDMEEEEEFEDMFRIRFRDPYCDGRDCTGVPFTAYMKFLKCEDRTIVIHRVCLDL